MNENEFENKLLELDEKIDELIQLNMFLNHKLNLINDLCIATNKELPNPQNFCPICGELVEFKPFGEPPRNNAQCPNCGSLERQRLIYMLFKQEFYQKFNQNNIKLLHFAPERIFYNIFNQKENIDYYPVDFSPEIYESRGINIRCSVNMENIPFPDNEFDIIYNSHVLEHVPNDIQGMKELYRVLDSNGICFTMVPLFNISKTFEKKEYNTPELRFKYYGQVDHLRKYGLDFKSKLESVGFHVNEIKASDIYESSIKKDFYGLLPSESIFVCTK